MNIVDAHIHVWTSDFDRYPLAPGFTPDDLWLPSFTPDDHFAYSRKVGKSPYQPSANDLVRPRP